MNSKNTREGNPQIFQVEKILQRGKAGDQVYYLVKWKGYTEAECTWEPQTNLEGCKQAIFEFEERVKLYQTHQLRSSKKEIHLKDSKNKLSLSSNKSLQKSSKNRIKKPKSMNAPIIGSRSFPSKVKDDQNVDSSKVLEQRPCSNQRVDKQQKNNNIELQKGKDASILQQQRRYEKMIESESEHESLEATTAQTIPPKDNQIPFNVSQELRKPFKASTIQSEIEKLLSNAQKDSVEPKKVINFEPAKINSLPKQKNTLMDQLMKREKPFEQKSIDKKNESIRKKIKQQTTIKPQNKSENQGDRNMSDHQLQKCTISSIQEKIKKEKIQLPGPEFGKLENEEGGLSGNQGSAKENKTTKEKSRRYLLCEQYLQDIKTQIIEDLCTEDQNSDEARKPPTRQILLKRFIDVTELNAKNWNQKLLKKVLSRTEVDRLDKEGEFLDSMIKMLLKVKCEDNEAPSKQWVCVIEKKSSDKAQQELLGSKHLVKVEDLKEDVWRRMFRKLTLCHQN